MFSRRCPPIGASNWQYQPPHCGKHRLKSFLHPFGKIKKEPRENTNRGVHIPPKTFRMPGSVDSRTGARFWEWRSSRSVRTKFIPPCALAFLPSHLFTHCTWHGCCVEQRSQSVFPHVASWGVQQAASFFSLLPKQRLLSLSLPPLSLLQPRLWRRKMTGVARILPPVQQAPAQLCIAALPENVAAITRGAEIGVPASFPPHDSPPSGVLRAWERTAG